MTPSKSRPEVARGSALFLTLILGALLPTWAGLWTLAYLACRALGQAPVLACMAFSAAGLFMTCAGLAAGASGGPDDRADTLSPEGAPGTAVRDFRLDHPHPAWARVKRTHCRFY